MKRILQTQRLYLREFEWADADFILELLNSEGWLKYIGDRNVKNKLQAEDYLNNGPFKSYEERGYGLSLVALKENEKAIGMCGLLNRDYLEHPDIGFAFLPEFTGKGYALEIAEELIHHAALHWGIKKISAIVQPDNGPSIKLLQKLGLQFIKEIKTPPANQVLLLYGN